MPRKTSLANRLPRSARQTGEALERHCSDEGIELSFQQTGAGHHAAVIVVNGHRRKCFFSTSPSDRRRASKKALCDLKNLIRNMEALPA